LDHGVGSAMLIDSFVPHPDASEHHAIAIAAPARVVYDAVCNTDLAESRVIRALLGLRVLPKLLVRGQWPAQRFPALRLRDLRGAGFGVLGEDRGREILLGVAGRFWRPVDNVLPFDERNFEGPVHAGTARAVWNFSVRESPDGRTVLSTETRIACGDASARRAFRVYWLLVRPFSGLIRLIMLRRIRRAVRA
jgi:hypothetical protein